jgi:hypothetical protein
MASQPLARIGAFECQEQAQRPREPTIVLFALWAVAIAFNPFRMLPEERVVHFALQRDIRRSFNRESRKRGRVHCLEPDAFGWSLLVVNSARTSAQNIDIVIMAAPPNRAHLRWPRIAAAQGSIAICERPFPKMSLVRVAAIRRRALRSDAQSIPLRIAASYDVQSL